MAGNGENEIEDVDVMPEKPEAEAPEGGMEPAPFTSAVEDIEDQISEPEEIAAEEVRPAAAPATGEVEDIEEMAREAESRELEGALRPAAMPTDVEDMEEVVEAPEEVELFS